jgi:hypothetical protein
MLEWKRNEKSEILFEDTLRPAGQVVDFSQALSELTLSSEEDGDYLDAMGPILDFIRANPGVVINEMPLTRLNARPYTPESEVADILINLVELWEAIVNGSNTREVVKDGTSGSGNQMVSRDRFFNTVAEGGYGID